jgi:hypothetical protein
LFSLNKNRKKKKKKEKTNVKEAVLDYKRKGKSTRNKIVTCSRFVGSFIDRYSIRELFRLRIRGREDVTATPPSSEEAFRLPLSEAYATRIERRENR